MKEWEESAARASRERALVGSKRRADASEAARRAQQAWLERYGVAAAAHGKVEDEGGRTPRLAELDALPIDAVLDLHGMTAAQAEAALSAFFATAVARGAKKVLIIHGKGIHSGGEAVLKKLTKQWLERCPAAGRSGKAERTQGGTGATWVIVKDGNQRSR